MKDNSTRLVQIQNDQRERKIALVQEPKLVLIEKFESLYDLAVTSISQNINIRQLIKDHLTSEKLDYSELYNRNSSWKLMPSFDIPSNPSNCMVSGTGLTHKASALNRQSMHEISEKELTDSMKIFRMGLEGGKPRDGEIGVQPEWFYKGTGHILKAHGEELTLPEYGDDGGEEPEIAGVYVIDKNGAPVRVGFTTGNEFSDHMMESKNYLYLAPSKLRECSIGPELVLDAEFLDVKGTVTILRNEEVVWSKETHTGEKNMSHSLKNLEYHHFKYPSHRIPGQGHVHFFGADAFSFGEKIKLQNGDVMKVSWEAFGRPLVNKILISNEEEHSIEIRNITDNQ